MSKLAVLGGKPACEHRVTYKWPKVTIESERLVLSQLRSGELSIYDRSGVIRDFETMFGEIHGAQYVLVTSSGTAALHSAYYAIGLGPGDEVLCSTYTFFATVMPLFQLGALPVLVDCLEDGTFDCNAAEALITDRTRAIVVTHMWGLPCDMADVVSFCERHSLALVEDCSHAHGATWNRQKVGTFGDAGAWSMQTKKIIAAGEGGVLLAGSRIVYDRAQLLGHFNKRAIQEMDTAHELYKYAATGLGLKYRAHPLGIAFALGQLPMLNEWISHKQVAAKEIWSILSSIPGVYPLGMSDDSRGSAYYAFTAVVNRNESGITRDRLVDAIKAENFYEIDIPKATSPLHTFEIFHEPLSPVFRYDRTAIRVPAFPVADRIASTSFKVAVPCEKAGDLERDAYIGALQAVISKLVGDLPALAGSRHEGAG